MQYRYAYMSYHLVMMEHFLGTGKGNVADVLNTGLIDTADIIAIARYGRSERF